MDDEQLEDAFLELRAQLVGLSAEISGLRVSVIVLRVCLATLMMPGQLEEALRGIENLEQQVLAADPTQPMRQQVADVYDALLKLRKRGVHEPDS
jgi:HAMP domain-containing protein